MPEIPTQKKLDDWRVTTAQSLQAVRYNAEQAIAEIERLREIMHGQEQPEGCNIRRGCCYICGEPEPVDARTS